MNTVFEVICEMSLLKPCIFQLCFLLQCLFILGLKIRRFKLSWEEGGLQPEAPVFLVGIGH